MVETFCKRALNAVRASRERVARRWTSPLRLTERLLDKDRLFDCRPLQPVRPRQRKTQAADAQKVGEYPRLDKADDAYVVIKADHLAVRMGIWAGKEDKIKKDDLAAYLATVDFKSMLKDAK